METLSVSGLTIRKHADGIEFVIDDDLKKSVTVRAQDLPGILEFLRSCTFPESDRRRGFRVGFQSIGSTLGDRFQTSVMTTAGRWVRVKPVNMSLTGILVETEEDVGAKGEDSSLRLVLDDTVINLRAIVVRRDPHHVAFEFTESFKHGGFEPAPKLIAIYRTLEMLWLRTRVKN